MGFQAWWVQGVGNEDPGGRAMGSVPLASAGVGKNLEGAWGRQKHSR